MCGIVGIVGLNPLEPVDETRLKRMRDVLRHRGPDGEGLWVEGRVGLGHRRLAIVDVEGGAQPMPNEDGSVWVVLNGEIYNHASLRPWLERRGHPFSLHAHRGMLTGGPVTYAHHNYPSRPSPQGIRVGGLVVESNATAEDIDLTCAHAGL